jgi:hypothetical protein
LTSRGRPKCWRRLGFDGGFGGGGEVGGVVVDQVDVVDAVAWG